MILNVLDLKPKKKNVNLSESCFDASYVIWNCLYSIPYKCIWIQHLKIRLQIKESPVSREMKWPRYEFMNARA